jgi:O-antigen/teichoic acid export membrane protein
MSRFVASFRQLLGGSFGRSLASLLIKVATAALTYLMYVTLSRLMGETAYGEFAFGLSLATILAVVAGVGQQTSVLRFWPEETVAGRPERATGALRSGAAITLLGGAVVTLVALAASGLLGAAGSGLGGTLYLMAAALLIRPMAMAEYNSSALRAQGSVWTALAPRDLAWRLSVCVVAYALFATGVRLGGPAALTLTAALLVAALLGQAVLARRRGYELGPGTAGLPAYWKARGRAGRWFLFGTAIDTAAVNLDVVIVGLLVTREAAGAYFNAFRTAGLMTLFLFASALVIAPLVARAYHGGDLGRAQTVLAGSAWAGFGFSVAVLVAFVWFGGPLLSLFGPEYGQSYPLLIILSLGLLLDAATGAARTTMVMTGSERAYVVICGAVLGAGFLLQFAVVPAFGLVGAALVTSGARVVSQLAIAWWCIARIGLDPTILGALRIRRDRRAVVT